MSCGERCNALKLSLLSVMCGASLFVASPFATLWSVCHAMQTRDSATLSHEINWRALNGSIKQQALGSILRPARDELPDFGSSFARTAVSNAVDVAVTPVNLPAIVDQTMPDIGPDTTDDGAVASADRFALLRHAHAHFLSPSTFEADIRLPGHLHETPLRITMKIQSWHWKVTDVAFPRAVEPAPASTPLMEASAAPSHA
ncbi:hypothetical protein AA103196_2744 [Ameyamaea chiangmaiensis NBRC 103196]|uniref:DUF2939 domain-containing protein n=2 Tax=Ameyamaea chiangmaiensis TaxID=442969 RepID=A0A850P9N3_9PROT|nr:DUF2939 domain-containing protein [Ameyamaea chiangmaiensis]NVN41277.1 DUF2939 domain-containing protein [Ameyamaea chiangmaiensis]GBQ71332.1 hypothetical protein AA103196_2744 [Ameyamaea chiangmaiensis NBRC 103196]